MYEKFSKLLEARGVSSYRVAKDIGFMPSVFSDWKAGRSTPKRDKIQKIADYFNVPISYFYGEEEPKPQYFIDEETAKLAQGLRDDQKVLMRAARNLTPDQIGILTAMVKQMKGDE